MNYLNLSEEKVLPVIMDLNQLLAEYHMYYQKLRNFHWNITGRHFFELHEKFEELYTDARIKIDEIAERILTLRYHPISNYSQYLNVASIKESSAILSDTEMVVEILKAHTTLLRQMAKVSAAASEIRDEGTADMVAGYIRDLEKTSWMLDAWGKSKQAHLKNVQPITGISPEPEQIK